MYVVATAGHVDHGKSSLVKALTGTDPDRWEEEKRRGLTIDLGFAHVKLPSGNIVGIVDVPGHERFIKNMLAGVGAVSGAIFVVAANEGWMPQSQEHLDILDLLGVRAAVVAITKADSVDGKRVRAVTEQTRSKMAGTTLAGAPVINVSATRGTGLDDLMAALDSVLGSAPEVEESGRPRLWVDRVFSMKGSGTVLTGTLIGGGLHLQQHVEILPQRVGARVRSLQSHGATVDEAKAGTRVALNLTGVETSAIHRGNVVSIPGVWGLTTRFIASVRYLSWFKPTEKGAFKLYMGSAETDAKLRFFDPPGGTQAADTTFVEIRVASPMAIQHGDLFVLRESGRRQTIGGGTVLEPFPEETGRGGSAWEAASRRSKAESLAEYLQVLLDEGAILPADDLLRRTGVRPEEVEDRTHATLMLASSVMSMHRFEEIRRTIESHLSSFHDRDPLLPGVERPELRRLAGLPSAEFDDVVAELEERGVLTSDGPHIRLSSHSPIATGPEQAALLETLKASPASPPGLAELRTRFGSSLIDAMVRAGELVRVSNDLVYSSESLEEMQRDLAAKFGEEGFTVAEFRDLIGASRKYAVPLLEYFDSAGVTRRKGDLRTLVR